MKLFSSALLSILLASFISLSVSKAASVHSIYNKSLNPSEEIKDTLNKLNYAIPSGFSSNSKVRLTFTLAKTARVNIKILDADGREIADLMDRNVPAGTFELNVETKNLKTGMYFCKFFTDEKIPMKKIIVVK